jgi:DNA-binding XRE family transcriptional regulator
VVTAILERIAANMSQRAVAEMFGVSRQSIRMLVERAEERGEMEPIKKRIAHKFFTVAELGSEEMRRRLEEEPDKIKYHELAVGTGIAVNNGNLLTGSATSITAKVVVDQGALAERLAELKKGVIDV